jgi:hypothetical protein
MKIQERLVTVPYWGFWLLLAYMPFHIFLSQSLSLTTGGLDAWKIGKDVVTVALAVFTICLVLGKRKGSGTFKWLIIALAVYGGLHVLLWLTHTDIYQRSAILGIIYNNRLIEFAIIGYGAAVLTPTKFAFSSLLKGILLVSTLVCILGIVQYFLPPDILTNAGYSLERGARPSFAIDDHPEATRIMSTLREPNALGAYLLVPLAALTALLAQARVRKQQLLMGGALVVHLTALFLTQSRSAWLAAGVVLGLIVCWCYYRQLLPLLRRFWPLVAVGVVLMLSIVWTQRNTTFFQRYIIHSNPDETVQDLDSNDLHWKLAKEGFEAAAAAPLGHGPGTAGIVSIQNPNGGLLTENYYIQLAYEIGWAGLAIFVALHVWIYRQLWRRRDTLGYILCATFWGYVVTNMLLHTWSNEAVAAQWWLLAGLAMVLPAVASDAPGAAKKKPAKS